jgi:phosphate-selective porin OprO and OprP
VQKEKLQMKVRVRLAVLAALALPVGLPLAHAADAPDTADLIRRLNEQEQRIRALEQKLAEQQKANGSAAAAQQQTDNTPPPGEAAVAQPGASPQGPLTSNLATPAVNTRSAGRQFAIQSADGSNVIRFRANVQLDGRWYSDNLTPVTSDTFLLRKVRPYIEGTVDDIYDFRLMPDFGQGKAIVADAYVAARFQPWFVVQAGKFKGPVGLERLQPDQFNRFLELGLPSDLVPNRDLGVQLGGDLFGGTLSYAVGYFDGVTDGNSTDANTNPDVDNDGKKDVEARLFSQPFIKSANPYLRGFGFGVGGTYVNATGSATNTLLATYKTAAAQNFFTYRTGASATYADGRRQRLAPQAFYYAGPVGVLAEYVKSEQDVSRQVSTAVKRSGAVDNSAWQVAAAWFLTGERASYNTFTPKSTFIPGKGGIGAWEIAARFEELRVGDSAFSGGSSSFADPAAAPRKATAYGVGLNWYPSQYVKIMLDYEITKFDGGAAGGADRPDEKAYLSRFQLAF